MNPAELYYTRDPIVEAIIGIGIEPLPPERTADFLSLQAAAGPQYTKQKLVYDFSGSLELGVEETTTKSTPTHVGYSFQTVDQQQIFTARTDAFSYHRLRPYPRWKLFRDEAARLWDLYREAVGSPTITQCELRYINRLEVPAGEELNTYLRTFPEIGPDLPQILFGYQLQVVLKLDRFKSGQLVLRQSMTSSDVPDHISIILDNSLLFQTDMDKEILWAVFEDARLEKNRIFHGCITPAMEARIK